MPKYLYQATYTTEGTKGLLKEGGSVRRTVIQKAAEGLGGKVEVFYYAFGAPDVFVIANLPDQTAALAFSLAVNASGGAQVKTTPLIGPEEMDQATKKAVDYRGPGK